MSKEQWQEHIDQLPFLSRWLWACCQLQLLFQLFFSFLQSTIFIQLQFCSFKSIFQQFDFIVYQIADAAVLTDCFISWHFQNLIRQWMHWSCMLRLIFMQFHVWNIQLKYSHFHINTKCANIQTIHTWNLFTVKWHNFFPSIYLSATYK